MNDKTQKIILDVPYYSQRVDIEDEHWKSRACGVVCLKMAMEYCNKGKDIEIPTIIDLIKEMEFINGFGSFGSDHESLVIVARNHGFHTYRQEFRSLANNLDNESAIKSLHEDRLTDEGIEKTIRKIEIGNPVIVSTAKNFSEKEKPHLVLLVGAEKEGSALKGFYYNDPDSLDEGEGKCKFVPIDVFREHWGKKNIFLKRL